eukprot:m.1632388 g.1632388  ORF g.1632388 m.1632388 type:complete len:60 (+) comp25405_c0_seq2:6459-6638(+)
MTQLASQRPDKLGQAVPPEIISSILLKIDLLWLLAAPVVLRQRLRLQMRSCTLATVCDC